MSQPRMVAAPRRLALLVAVAVAIVSAGALTHPAATYAWDTNAYSSSDESKLVSLTNQSRASAGLPSLKVSSHFLLQSHEAADRTRVPQLSAHRLRPSSPGPLNRTLHHDHH